MDLFITKYERLSFVDDFNMGMEESSVDIFYSNCTLISTVWPTGALKIQRNWQF